MARCPRLTAQVFGCVGVRHLPQGPARRLRARLKVRQTGCTGWEAMPGMKRREFISLLGGAAPFAAWPLAARAQQPERMRRIGVLMAFAENDPEYQTHLKAFAQELQKLGWTEGRNIQVDS